MSKASMWARPRAPAVLNALSVRAPPVKQVVEGALMAAGGPLTR